MKQANLYLKRTQTNYCPVLHPQVKILFTWILCPNSTSHTHKAKPGLLEKKYLWNYFKSIARACLICHIIPRNTREHTSKPTIFKASHEAKPDCSKSTVFRFRPPELRSPRISSGHTQPQGMGEEPQKCCKRETYSGDLGFRQLIIRLFKIPSTFHTPNSSERTTWQRKGKMTSEMTLALINSFILWAAHEEGKINVQHTWAYIL